MWLKINNILFVNAANVRSIAVKVEGIKIIFVNGEILLVKCEADDMAKSDVFDQFEDHLLTDQLYYALKGDSTDVTSDERS